MIESHGGCLYTDYNVIFSCLHTVLSVEAYLYSWATNANLSTSTLCAHVCVFLQHPTARLEHY